MCYPDAEEPMDKFFEAYDQFERDLRDILIFGTSPKERYIKIHSAESGTTIVSVHLQRNTHKIVKIVVNTNMSEYEHKKDPVDIFAEDATLASQLNALDSVKCMRENAAIIREIIYEDEIIVALKYGMERVSIFKPK
jgi:hypothetical protein